MGLYDPVYGISGQPTLQFGNTFPSVIQPPVAQPMPQVAPTTSIFTLNGEAAAKSLKLTPGSTLLASDESEPIIWFIKANDVGPNTVYKIPFDPSIFSGGSTVAKTDLSAIETRLADIEERMSRYESNAGADKSHNGNGSNPRR